MSVNMFNIVNQQNTIRLNSQLTLKVCRLVNNKQQKSKFELAQFCEYTKQDIFELVHCGE
jgi:hypothetical protein